jgi:hypothetical protein
MMNFPKRYVGDIIEFELKLNTDMTGDTSPSNPGGYMTKEDGTQSVALTYVVIDITIGHFILKFNTAGLSPGIYNIQMWWSHTDAAGLHSMSTDVYKIELLPRLAPSP